MRFIPKINSKNSIYIVKFEDDSKDKDMPLKGVYLQTEKVNSKTQETYEHYEMVSSLIYIKELVMTEKHDYYKIVWFRGDIENEILISASNLLTHSYSNYDELESMMKQGLIIHKRNSFFEYFQSACCTKLPQTTATEETGWTDDGEYIANGFSTCETPFIGSSNVIFVKRGSEEEQIKLWREVFEDNPLVFFCVSYLYAGIISKFILHGEANPIVAITGISSSGKTTLEKFGLGGFTQPDRFLSFNATAGSLERMIHQNSDLFACIDEVGENKQKDNEKTQWFYSIANGKGKSRLKKDSNGNYQTQLEEQKRYSLLFCGEVSFLEGLKKQDGVKVRFNEVVISKDLPLWNVGEDLTESVEDKQKKTALMEYLTKRIYDNYGHIAPLFINLVKSELNQLKDVYIEQLNDARTALGSDSDLINRKAKGLAYSYTGAHYLGRIIWGDNTEEMNEAIYNMKQTAERALFSSIQDMTDSRDEFLEKLSHIEITHQQYFKNVDVDNDDQDIKMKEYLGEISFRSDGMKIIMIPSTVKTRAFQVLEVSEDNFIAWLNSKNYLKKDGQGKSSIVKKGKRFLCIQIPLKDFDDEQIQPIQQIKPINEQPEIIEDLPRFKGEM
jgi:hypothetical protein